MATPLVSVVMITYGHEAFILDAIKGVVNQKTMFPVEIIISDDHSPDQTEKVVRDYLKSMVTTFRITYVRHRTNKGMMQNLIWALRQCQGSYIALCEGDDYWTDPHKLQKQVEYMELHPDCTLAAHDCTIVHEGLPAKQNASYSNPHRDNTAFRFDFIDEFNRHFIPNASVVFRKCHWFDDMTRYLEQNHIGDIPLFLFALRNGHGYYINEQLSVYRRHAGGITQSGPWRDNKLERLYLNWLKIAPGVPTAYQRFMNIRLAKFELELARRYAKQFSPKSVRYIWLSAKRNPKGLFSKRFRNDHIPIDAAA